VVVEDQGFDQFLLMYGDLFSALDGCLKEERVEELSATLEVLIDLNPMMLQDKLLAQRLESLLPSVIGVLGSERSTLRKMAYKCLSQFVKRTSKLEFVLSLIIQHGF
jgi:hypothetical protein